ncbi:MAG: nickel pincer cofactor biosynthesis protein LarC [Chloroflexi bacterium]|nr:nickel pincer cofactor biosynthesis protein LarC [Chloroflexota bacterium]
MKYAYCDCFSGLSGDMFLGALVDAGVPVETLREQIALLNLPEPVEIKVEETKRGALRACSVEVITGESHHHRHYTDIVRLIEDSPLSDPVKRTSLGIFKVLAEAEARVHGTEIEHVHFHEVGALDSIVDIVGAAVGLDVLGIERLYSSAVPFSGGQVQTQHGTLPVPAPATLEVLIRAHALMTPSPAQVELVTPTGAAILASLATFERPNLVVTGVGVGAGKRELPWPNIFRLILGESAPEAEYPLVLIETNIDDMNPQMFGHVMSRLFAAGALDVYLTPIYMKKNRPATLMGVVARKQDEPALARLILSETSTLGMRVQPVYRYTAQREFRKVETPYGEVAVKIKMLDGRPVQAMPEYDDCARIAEEQNVALSDVYTAALLAGSVFVKDTGR